MKNLIDFTIVNSPPEPKNYKGFISIEEWGDVGDAGFRSFEMIRKIADIYGTDEDAVALAEHIVVSINTRNAEKES